MKLRFFIGILFFMLVFLLFTSCEEKKQYLEITAKVVDPANLKPIEGATVRIYASYTPVDAVYSQGNMFFSGISNSEGKVTWLAFTNRTTYFRIEVSKDNYISQVYYYDTYKMNPPENTPHIYYLPSKSLIKINVKNQYPFDERDFITFWYSSKLYCSECCRDYRFIKIGKNVDTTIYCYTAGGMYSYVSYMINKNNNVTYKVDSFFVPPFDTAYFNICY